MRAIGYTDVELLWSFGNFGRTVPQVKAALKATGLKAPSAHMAPETAIGAPAPNLASEGFRGRRVKSIKLGLEGANAGSTVCSACPGEKAANFSKLGAVSAPPGGFNG